MFVSRGREVDTKSYCHGNVTTGVLEQSVKTFNNWLFFSITCLMGKIISKVTHLKGSVSDRWPIFPNMHTHTVPTLVRLSLKPFLCGAYLQIWWSHSHTALRTSARHESAIETPPSNTLLLWGPEAFNSNCEAKELPLSPEAPGPPFRPWHQRSTSSLRRSSRVTCLIISGKSYWHKFCSLVYSQCGSFCLFV